MKNAFAKILLRPILLQAGGILALVLAVFLAEILTSNLEAVLHLNGSALDVAVLLALSVPEILDLALALAVMVAVFLSVREAGRRGELLVVAGAGVPSRKLVLFVVQIGLCGAALSLLVSSVVLPSANYAKRAFEHSLEVDYITRSFRQEVDNPPVQSTSGYQFVAAGFEAANESSGPFLVVREDLETNFGWRYAVARGWRVAPPDGERKATLQLDDPVGFGFLTERGGNTLGRFDVNAFEAEFDVVDAYPVFDAGRAENENAKQAG